MDPGRLACGDTWTYALGMFLKDVSRFFSVPAALITTGWLLTAPVAVADATPPQAKQAFRLSVHVPDDVTVGKKATVTVTIKANEGFKINKSYPAKLKLDETRGVSFDKLVLRRSDAALKDKGHTLVFSVGYVQNRKGSAELKGKLKFSVCSASRCMMERKTIQATLKAK